MANKDFQFLKKLNSLPEEVSLYFSSNINAKINKELSTNYNLDENLIYDLVCDFFISDFNIDDLNKNIIKKINNKTIIKDFTFDFLGKLFFPVAPFLSSELENQMKNNGLKLEKYQDYINEFNLLIEDKNFETLDVIVDNFEKNFDEKEEENIVLDFLEKNLLEILRNDDISGSKKLNGSMVYLLINKKDSLGKFIRSFLANEEKIGSNRIMIDNKDQEPTISNWIKHFIKENGSEIFSNIILVKYLTSASVTNILNDDERKILRKVLKLYRNLVFFPDSMANISIEDWEIIPIDRDADFANKNIKKPNSKVISQSDKASEPQKITTKDDLNNTKNDLEQKISEEINLKNKELQELKDMIEKYPEKSLEKKAIKSEIKKRENKI